MYENLDQKIIELPAGMKITDRQLEEVVMSHTSRSDTNPRKHLNTI